MEKRSQASAHAELAAPMENSAVPASEAALATTVRSSEHSLQSQRRRLLDMYEREELTDVVLLLQPDPADNQAFTLGEEDGEVRVAAHRVVLATASPFFRALFTNGMKESREPKIQLPGMSVSAFRELLRYIYMGELRVNGDTILSILHTADRLELWEVVEMCCKQLMRKLNVANCVDIYMCCEQLQLRSACQLLAQAARAMIDTYFQDVYESAAFKNLPLDAMLKILRQHHQPQKRNAMADGADSAAVTAWVMHDPLTRQRELASILEPKELAGSIGNDSDSSAEVAHMILNRRNSDGAMVNSKAPSQSPITPEDVDMVSMLATLSPEATQKQQWTPTIFAIGGFNVPGALKTVEYLDFHRNEWFPAASMAEQRSYSGVAVSQSKIFVLGGTVSSRHLKTVEMFDPERNIWTRMPPMTKERSYLGATTVGDFIYAVGGFNGMQHLASVERFDLRTQRWEELPSLKIGRSGLSVVALNGLVFAIGGYDGQQHLKSVEVFDPQTLEWSLAPSMRYARNGPAAVAQEQSNGILVFGGESRHGVRMNTSERLDLNRGMWTDVDSFADCRSGHVAFSFLSDSFLFCLGGSNKKDKYLDTVHRYDYLSKQWMLHSHMCAQRCGLNVAVVKTSPQAACFLEQRQMEQRQKEIQFYKSSGTHSSAIASHWAQRT